MSIKKNFHISAHAGRVLQMMLDEIGMSQLEFARRLGERHSKINEICRGKRGISADMSVKLGKIFGQSPDLWMGLQDEWELSQIDESKYDHLEPIKIRA